MKIDWVNNVWHFFVVESLMENVYLENKTFYSFKLSSKCFVYDKSDKKFDLLKCSSFS